MTNPHPELTFLQQLAAEADEAQRRLNLAFDNTFKPDTRIIWVYQGSLVKGTVITCLNDNRIGKPVMRVRRNGTNEGYVEVRIADLPHLA